MADKSVLADVLHLLACPACGGTLIASPSRSTQIDCSNCGRHFPVEDQIPVLLVDRASAK